jgi:hypothetical protein
LTIAKASIHAPLVEDDETLNRGFVAQRPPQGDKQFNGVAEERDDLRPSSALGFGLNDQYICVVRRWETGHAREL